VTNDSCTKFAANQVMPQAPWRIHVTDEVIARVVPAYFVAHPEMVLGVPGASSGMYGAGYTVALPDGGREETIATLVERMRALPSGLLRPAPPSIAATPWLRVPLTDDVGHLQDSARPVVETQISSAQTLRVPALLAVRDAARAALRAQLDAPLRRRSKRASGV
jgi:Arc/MetJ family transcription regulator